MDVTYKDLVAQSMEMLAQNDRVVFMGYNVVNGRGGGAFAQVHESRLIELPLAENLCAGMAIGMALEGYIPVLWIERMDFILNALDAIVNHLDKLETLSNGIHRPAVITRTVVGNKVKPLFTGPTHTQSFSVAIREMVTFPVIDLKWPSTILTEYRKALDRALNGQSTLLSEDKDLYDDTITPTPND